MTIKNKNSLGLVGFGKMGRMVYGLALQKGFNVVSIVDPRVSDSPISEGKFYPTLTAEAMRGVSVWVDFSEPRAVIGNLEAVLPTKVPVVIGTTGWLKELERVRSLTKAHAVPVIYASNFSVGMNIYFKLLQSLISHLGNGFLYDVGIREIHHSKKLDAPSGTALSIAEILAPINKMDSRALHQINALRVGENPGEHEVILDSVFDTISLKHSARSREGFGVGALWAAEYIHQLTPGLYNFTDIFDQVIKTVQKEKS